MGSSSSKPLRSAVSATSRRQYPQQPSPSTTTIRSSPRTSEQNYKSTTQGPIYHTKEDTSSSKSEAIDFDSSDSHFAASLRSIGPVIPNPTFSNSSTFHRPVRGHGPSVLPDSANPTLLVVSSRARITKAAEREAELLGRQSHEGREFLDVQTIRQALAMRDKQGLPAGEIERLLRLKSGVMDRLGKKGVLAEVG